ncbi:hypothetical protein [Vannielia litorea]|uniref:hypothetical protein n=1 Tax=Vannielia litorea TaxID=1217970 RepID=UPI001BCB6999|nr:hypothetical protein [Vannielia litorea]MBS8225349.1 restriction endonuclease [Vannielia litorea]
MNSALQTIRTRKFAEQKGLCHYCMQAMWSGDPKTFCAQHGISRRKAKLFQCTAEHLLANQNGGVVSATNIVAACRYCNATRHRAKRPLEPEAYKRKVANRLEAGRWNRLKQR